MGACRVGRPKNALFFAALVIAALSTGRHPLLQAQELSPPQRWDGLIELISGRYSGQPPAVEPPIPADGPSQMTRHAVSDDGRYIVFTAEAPSLGYSESALYIRDRRTNETRVLLAGPARDPVISGDGNHVAFTICDPWARPDNLPICDIWSLDLRTWAWNVMSSSASGGHGLEDSRHAVISSTGRFVVFETTAPNLILEGAPGAATSPGVPQIVLRDRDVDGNGIFDEPGTALLDTVSVHAYTGAPGAQPSATADVSDDGRFVAFRSKAFLAGDGDWNDTWDVFRRDRGTRQTVRISMRPGNDASPVSIESATISMSADGRFVAFASGDPLLAPAPIDDTNNALDVFVWDEASPYLTRVDIGTSAPGGGYVPGNGHTMWPSLSSDGRYVALQSTSTNVLLPPPAGTAQVYVVDRQTGVPTRIGIGRDGSEADAATERPLISGDASLVAFMSQALNLTPDAQGAVDRIYAAVHFEITPTEVAVPAGGGTATYTVTTQQHTQWWVDWTNWQYWIRFDGPPTGVGSGELRLHTDERNHDPASRQAEIRIFQHAVVFKQLEGLALTGVSPASGPEAGGTRVTLTGTGFEPDMRIMFDGLPAVEMEFVDSTTARVTTPAHEPGTVWVGIITADYSGSAWLDEAFYYLDGTPPEIWHWVEGQRTDDGWYTSDATIWWAWWDEHSQATVTSGCQNVVLNTDTSGATYSCTVTSEGGTASQSVTVKRDTTGPSIAITSPAATLYELNSVVQPAYTCTDALSGVAQCGSPTHPSIDTSTSGWRTHYAFAMDRAGNPGWSSAEYAVGYGVCTRPTIGLRLWFEFEGNGRESVHGSPHGTAQPQWTASQYVEGKVGQALGLPGWQFFALANELDDVRFTEAMTVAAWVKAEGQDGEAGVIVSKEDQFRIARFADGTLRWAFASSNPGFTWVNTNATIPAGQWTHVAVTYNQGIVHTYVNGRLAHTYEGAGGMQTIQGLPYWGPWVSIGNRFDPAHPSFFTGAIDEVQLLDTVWDASAVEASFLSGAQGTCRLVPTVALAASASATYGQSSFVARIQLRTGATEQPIPSKPVRVVSYVSPDGSLVGSASGTTDDTGWLELTVPMAPDAPVGSYATGVRAYFDGDQEYGGAAAFGSVMVNAAIPALTWPAPSPIVYGTALGAAQLRASASVPGVFWYSHSSGTVLPVGTHSLSVRFDPDSSNYEDVTASVVLEVTKARPILTWHQPAAIVYGTPLDATHLNATSSVPGTWSYSPAAGTLLGAGAGQTLTATFTPADATSYDTASMTTTIDVARATPTLTVTGGTYTYDAQPHHATGTLTGAGGATLGPIEFVYNGLASLPVDAGTYSVEARYAGDANYDAVTATAVIVVKKAVPTIAVTGGAFTYDGSAHGASGTVTGINGAELGAPSFTYNGASTTPVNAGSYAVVASYGGNANYESGSSSTVLTIARATAALSWPSPAAIVYGTVLGSNQLNASSSIQGTFDYSPNAGTLLDAGNGQTLTASFVPSDAANYDGGSISTTIDVEKAAPAVSIVGGTFTYDGTAHRASGTVAGLNGETLGPLVFSYNGSTEAPVSAGSYTVDAHFAGNANYAPASATATITIARAAAVLSWSQPATVVYGTPLGAAQLNATSSVSGSFVYAPGAGAILPAGPGHTLSASFTPSDTANYIGGSVATSLDVTPAPLSIRANDAVKRFGAPLPAFSASAIGFVNGESFSSLQGTLAFSTTASQQSPVGAYPIVPSGVVSPNYAMTFVSGVLSVVRGEVRMAVGASPEPSGHEQPVTLTANVSAALLPSAEPTGTVRFYDGVTLLGTSVLSFGTASLTTAGLDPGTRAIEARYDGDASFETGSQSTSHLIHDASATPIMTLSSSRNPSSVGQSVTMTATISMSSGPVDGVVTFYSGATLLGSSSISAGRATLTTSSLPAGSHAIIARYAGSSGAPPTRSGVFVQAVGAQGWKNRASALTLTSSDTSALGEPVDFVAHVTGTASWMPTGRVLFMINGEVAADVALSGLSGTSARATLLVDSFNHGRHTVSATYLGDPNYKGSTGTTVQTVN